MAYAPISGWGGARNGSGPRPKTAAELEAREQERRVRAIGAPLSQSEIERFNEKVARSAATACWPWTGSRLKKRGSEYGRLTIRSRVTGAFGVEYAHRIAHWIATGVMPTMFVLHSCNNPPCCNPRHLREGTVLDNASDTAIAEHHAARRLTKRDVLAIRNGKRSDAAWARRLRVGRSAIRRARLGITWKHIP